MSTSYFAPAFEVRVADSPVAEPVANRITEVSITTEPGTMDTFRIVLANPLPELPFTHGALADAFVLGTAVEIRMGYADALERLFAGEVTAVEPAFPESGAAAVTVSGQTRLHHLRGSTKTRTFLKMSDREIAQKVLDELPSSPLTLEADPTPDRREYVMQYNQTDLAFLLDRAMLLGFSLWVDDRTLNFKQAATDDTPTWTLVWGRVSEEFGDDHLPLRTFTPRLSTLRPVTKMIVHGYDQKNGQRFEATAPAGSSANGRGAAAVVSAAGRSAEARVVDRPLESQAEAQNLADALYHQAAMELITGSGATVGEPTLRSGTVVELQGLGPVFDGAYSVTQSTHTISSAGYLTTFNAHKGTVG